MPSMIEYRESENLPYWLRWAHERGHHYFSERDPGETAESIVPLVSDDPRLRDAIIAGWNAARTETELGALTIPQNSAHAFGAPWKSSPQTREEYERDVDAHERMTGQHTPED